MTSRLTLSRPLTINPGSRCIGPFTAFPALTSTLWIQRSRSALTVVNGNVTLIISEADKDTAGIRRNAQGGMNSHRSSASSMPSVATLGWILFWKEIDRPELPSWVDKE
jgi:hypothetical protein